MTLYLDSSALVKLYVTEGFSDAISTLGQRADVVFALNELHQLEVRNAIRLRAFRGAITPQEQMLALSGFDADVSSDLYKPAPMDFAMATRAAERLSAAATAHTGARALDLLHVAAAQLGACDAFATFDARQRDVARIAGLTIFEIDSSR